MVGGGGGEGDVVGRGEDLGEGGEATGSWSRMGDEDEDKRLTALLVGVFTKEK